MASYDKSKRFSVYEKCWIGPGAYDVNAPRNQLCHNEGTGEGFLTSVERKTIIKEISPAPNEYYGYLYRDKNITGGLALQYTEKRKTGIFGPVEVTPGPAAYDPGKPITRSEGVGKIRRGAPPHGTSYGPSIPSRRHMYGYEIDENGKVTKINPPECTGPSYISPPEKDIHEAEKKYKGNAWSKRTDSRKPLVDGCSGPGPADYNLNPLPPTFRDLIYEYNRQLLARSGKCERSVDQMQNELKRQNFPSPATYDIIKLHKLDEDDEEIEVPTIPQAERFTSYETDTPAPGTYDDKIFAIKPYKPSKKPKKDIAFSSTAPRFKKLVNEVIPEEHLQLYAKIIQKIITPNYKKNVAFLSTEPRFRFQINDTPGAEEYTLDDMASRSKKLLPRIWGTKRKCFGSSAKRFPVRKDYYSKKESNSITEERFNEKAEKTDSHQIQQMFKTNRECKKELFKLFCKPMNDPGPGSYNTDISSFTKGVSISSLPRKIGVEVRNDSPGPAAYALPKSLVQPVFNTHNVKLKSGKEKWKEPRQRPHTFMRMATARKVLWEFVDPEVKYH